jgi:hypothetical protein
MSVFFYLSVFSMWCDLPILALIFESCSAGIFIFEFLLYYEVIDRFAPDATAWNVYGVIEPSEDVKNIVIFSGHHDSAHVFHFMDRNPNTYVYRAAAFLAVIFTQWFYQLYLVASRLLKGELFSPGPWTSTNWFFAVFVTIGIVAVVPMWFFVEDGGTPGAGDNLISSVMGVKLAERYSKRSKLRNTRLVFMSFDAEEICLKGSRAFFRQHKKEYTETKTWHFNVDCPYCVHDLKFLTRDVNGFVPLSKRFAEHCTGIAHELGYAGATACPIFFLSGATDAAESAAIGIEATSLVGIKYAAKDAHGRAMVYHTPRDTIAAIEPEVVEATMRIFMQFVDEVDTGRFS